MELAELFVPIKIDMQNFKKQLSSVQDQLAETGKKMQKVGKSMTTFITLPLMAAGGAGIKYASDLEESINKVSVAFGDNAKEIESWSKDTLKQFGIAQGSALDMAALFGDMGTSMGLTTGEAADMSKSLTGLAGDLASFKNIGIAETQTALKSIFTGETESLKNMGIVMTQTNLEAFAMSQGIQKNIKDLTQAEQVQLRYAYVMAMTKNAQGDFANTSDGASNQMRIFQESLKELAAEFGKVLLPLFTAVVTKINAVIQKFTGLDDSTKKIIVIIAALTAIIGPLLVVIGTILAMIPQMVAGFGMLKGAMLAIKTASMSALIGPFGLVVAAIAAVIAIGVLLYKNWDKIKETAINVGKAVSEAFAASVDFVKGIFTGFIDFIKERIQAMKDAFMIYIDFLKNVFTGDFEAAFQNIKDFLSKFVSEAFAEFVQKCYDFGKNIVSSIADGIKSKINDVKDAISDVTSKVRDYLPFSPAKEGPLKDLNKLNFGGTISDGIYSGMGEIQTAMNTALNVPNVSSTGGRTANITIDLDGRTIAQSMGTHLVDNIRVGTGSRI